MKKTSLFLGILMAFSLLFSSCSDELQSQTSLEQRTTADINIILKLDSINNDIMLSSPHKANKGHNQDIDLSKWEKAQIVMADARGAYSGSKKGATTGGRIGTFLGHPLAGGIIGGIVGGVVKGGLMSYVKYQRILNEHKKSMISPDKAAYGKATDLFKIIMTDSMALSMNSIDFINPDVKVAISLKDSILDLSNFKEAERNVGLAHNLTLAYLEGKITINENLPLINKNTYVNAIINSEDFKRECIDISTDDGNDVDSNDLPESVMRKFYAIYEQYANDCVDVAFIIQKYIEVIDSSNELTPEEKKNVKYGLATALYSTNYWEHEYKK